MDVLKLLEHFNFSTSNISGDVLRSKCLIHGGTNPTSFVMNIKSGLWFCHSGCGGGDIFTLVERMKDMNFPQSVEYLSDFFDVDVSNMKTSRNKLKTEKELENFINAIKRSHTTPLESFEYNANAVGIAKYRDFSKDTLDVFKVKYAKSIELPKKNGEFYTIYDRILIPIIFDEKQIGISLRKTKASDFPKWLHQPRGLKVSNTIYNYDNIYSKKEIVVVEGVFDVWAFYEIGLNAGATFGAHLTHQQYTLLLQSGADIVLAYDGDSAGKKATSKAIELLKYTSNLSLIEFEDNQDPASLNRKELLSLYERRKRL